MNHFQLINDRGYESPEAVSALDAKLAAGAFDVDRDAPLAESEGCLCSHGTEECWHAGRDATKKD